MTLADALDQEEALSTLRKIMNVPSVTGNETALAELLHGQLDKLGPQELELIRSPQFRANLVATFSGESKDQLLLFAHLDTVGVAGWEEFWDAKSLGDPRRDPNAGAEVGGFVWGRGTGDVKGGIATVISALSLLKNSKTKLAKTVSVVFVSDEESGEPGMGLSTGIKAIMPNLKKQKSNHRLAVYLEPTNLEIYIAQMGFQIVDVRVEGRTAYFGTPELGIDALKIAHQILDALWKYNEDLSIFGEHKLIGHSNLLVTNLKAGGFIAVPGSCDFSLIRKILPGESLKESARKLEDVIQSVPIPQGAVVSVSFTAGRDDVTGGTPLENEVNADLEDLQRVLRQRRAGKANFVGAPYWSEAPIINRELQVPCIYWAAGDISNCHTFEERISVDDYIDAVVSLAEYMAEPWSAV